MGQKLPLQGQDLWLGCELALPISFLHMYSKNIAHGLNSRLQSLSYFSPLFRAKCWAFIFFFFSEQACLWGLNTNALLASEVKLGTSERSNNANALNIFFPQMSAEQLWFNYSLQVLCAYICVWFFKKPQSPIQTPGYLPKLYLSQGKLRWKLDILHNSFFFPWDFKRFAPV